MKIKNKKFYKQYMIIYKIEKTYNAQIIKRPLKIWYTFCYFILTFTNFNIFIKSISSKLLFDC